MRISQKGVTLVELLVVIGIISILFAIGWVSLPNIERESNLDAWATEIKDTLYQAQAQTINGTPSGVYFEAARFVLFEGDIFVEGNPANQQTNLTPNLQIASINLTNSTITFEGVTGYVKNFLAPANLTLQDQPTGKTRLININRLGVVEVE